MENVTRASDIVAPPLFEDVELEDLQTSAGTPVVVRCHKLPPLMAMQHVGLPGGLPRGADGKVEISAAVEASLNMLVPVLETSTAIRGDGEEWVRPGFTRGGGEGSVPIEYLTDRDAARLFATAIRLSGRREVPAGDFPDRNGARGSGRVGTPPGGERVSADPVGSAP